MVDIVLTGVSSFVGHHLARHLAMRGHRVVATLSRPRGEYHGIEAERLAVVAPLIDLVRLNLREHRHITELVEQRAPSVWIQHAGFATGYSSPDYNLETAHLVNVAPLTTLYSALRGSGCGVIVTGSSAEYSASDAGNRESDACMPDTPYGLSKLT
jgi:nucleoside-diphosphate-sugar epimerase